MWWVVVVTLALTFDYAVCDPCDTANHSILIDTRRRPSYTTGPNEDVICDLYLLTDGNWYRFGEEGAPMSTTCPAAYMCATDAPIYLDGTNPTVQDGEVSHTVCQHDYRGCCGVTYDIKAKQCATPLGNFYVYKLTLPIGCDAAYCADFKCNSNQVYNFVNDSCEDGFPLMTKPVLTGPVYEPADPQSRFYFECEITGYSRQTTDDGSRFEVTFLADDVTVVHVTEIDSTSLVARLYDANLASYHVGRSVRCKARSYWGKNVQYAGPHQESVDEYYIGTKVLTEDGSNEVEFVLHESDQEQKIMLQTTVPVICNKTLYRFGVCQLTFVVVAESNNFAGRTCQLTIKEDDWDQNTKLATSSDNFTVAVPAQPGGGIKTGLIQFNQIKMIRPLPLWNNVRPPPIKVRAVLENLITCYVFTDPHIITFDRKRTRYGIYDPGNFIITRSSASRRFEIHAKFRYSAPWPTYSTVCAVAVREGNDAVGVDICRNKIDLVQYSPGLLGEGTSVVSYSGGRTFNIKMASGTTVKIQHDTALDYLNFQVYAIPEDKGKLEGLCGTYDSDPNNDFKINGEDRVTADLTAFYESWRLAPGSSLFDLPFVEDNNATYIKPEHCACTDPLTRTITCFSDLVDPGNNAILINGNLRQNADATTRGKRGATSETEHHHRRKRATLIWPTPSGITETDARTVCQNAIDNTPAKQACDSVVSTDEIDMYLSSCAFDIQAADNTTIAQGYQVVYEDACVASILTNITITDNDTDTNEGLLKLKEVQAMVCPNNCNNRGSCVNSECVCATGHSGPDCSVDASKPPSIDDTLDDGFCDLHTSECLNVQLYGSNIDGAQVTCRITQHKLEGGRSAGNDPNKVKDEPGITIAMGVVVCPLPHRRTRRSTSISNKHLNVVAISLSNNGLDFSSETMFTVYDSASCITCSTTSCDIQVGHCVVDGTCYQEGEPNPTANCQICNSSNPSEWTWKVDCDEATTSAGNNPPAETTSAGSNPLAEASTTPVWVYIAAAAGALVIVVVITVGVLLKKKKKVKRVDSYCTDNLPRPPSGVSRKLSSVGVSFPSSLPPSDTVYQ